MKEPTLEEVLKLVRFRRDENGKLQVSDVNGNVQGDVLGSVWGSVSDDVSGNVWGNVWGNVHGDVGNVWGSVHGNVGIVHGNVGIVRGDVSDVFGTAWGISSNILRDKVVELIKSNAVQEARFRKNLKQLKL